MVTYITLIQFTEQGIHGIRQTTKRADAFVKATERAGVNVKEIYWTVGQFDGVLILEAPDEESGTAALLALGQAGNVRTRTLRAFDRSGIETILEKLP